MKDDIAARGSIDTLDAFTARMGCEIQRFGYGVPDDEIPPEKKKAMGQNYLTGLRGVEMKFRKTAKRSLRRRKEALRWMSFARSP